MFWLPWSLFHCSLGQLQDHTSQDHFCSVINEFPVWNSKSFKPRWWDTVPHPEREADPKPPVLLIIDDRSLLKHEQWWMGEQSEWPFTFQRTWSSTTASFGRGQNYFKSLHLSSSCMATLGGAVSQFFRLCFPFLVDLWRRMSIFWLFFQQNKLEGWLQSVFHDNLASFWPCLVLLRLQIVVLLWVMPWWRKDLPLRAGLLRPNRAKQTQIKGMSTLLV